MDLKTAFLQGEAYDESRDIICQIMPDPIQVRISTTHRSKDEEVRIRSD